MSRTTHTLADLPLSAAAYEEIATALRAAGYSHAFLEGGRIDMSGIAVCLVSQRSAVFDVTWFRADAPDDLFTCRGLDARTLTARLMSAARQGSVVVQKVTATLPTREVQR